MSDKCRFTSTTTPRVLPGRHTDDCPDHKAKPKGATDAATCDGCQPCTKPHCTMPSCPGRHASTDDPFVCATCVSDMRTDLDLIAKMCGFDLLDAALRTADDPADSEAVMLLGPVAWPDSWFRRRELAVAGIAPKHYLEDARDEAHPLFVLGTWEDAWRDWLGHDSTETITIGKSASYLNLSLTYVARQPDVPMGQFASDLRRCRGHLEDVIRDAEPEPKKCPKCGGALVMDHEPRGGDYIEGNEERDYDDKWQCQRKACGQWWTQDDYRTKVEAVYGLHAPALPVSELALRTGVPRGTIQRWAGRRRIVGEDGTPTFKPPLLRPVGRTKDGRRTYRVADVERLAQREKADSA